MNPALPASSRILVVDDALSIHDDFRKILAPPSTATAALIAAQERLFGEATPAAGGMTFQVDCATQGQEGLAKLKHALADKRPYAIAFVDMRMPPGWDGIETARQLWAADPSLQIVICTAYSDRTWDETLMALGVRDSLLILKKPFDNIEVLQLAHALSAKWAIARRDRERMDDLDERVRQRTAELREAEGRFSKIFHANPVPTALQALADGRFVDANPAFLRLVGYTQDEMLQRSSRELNIWVDASVCRQIVDSLKNASPLRCYQTKLRTKGGAQRDVLVSVESVALGAQECVLTSLEDITERLVLEQKLQQSQKMEAVGQLAAGVAHDFNNLLTVIQSYTSLTLDDRQLAARHREALGQVRTAADRAAALTRQLLVFTRRQITRLEPLSLSVILARMQEMLRRLVPEHIALEWHTPGELPQVVGDEANMEQIIMNLAVNARDAMPNGGRITFTIQAVTLDCSAATRHPDARPGKYIEMSVADTGSGMTPEVMAHIFEPFFTTKSVGKGTGLGLSTVYAIVRQHGGWIEVSSELGKGTRFDVFIPAATDTKPMPAVGNAHPTLLQNGKGERILLVEDEQNVRLATATIVKRAGYDVTEAVDVPEALDAWRASNGRFALLLTDMVMPKGTGSDLAKELRTADPQLKVIITTGYSRELLRETSKPPAHTKLLLKPFTASELLSAIRQTLDTKPH